jgi:tripartite-type tricarboxylate transporter receptor subunit TctC
MNRRALLAAPFLLTAGQARGAAWSDKPVRVVVPYPAGGWADAGARILFTRVGQRLGQPFVVENRSGAGGQVGSQSVATSPADGGVLLYGASSLAVAPSLYARMNFLPLRDLLPVAMVVRGPVLMVANNSRPERSVAEVIATAKRLPGGLDWASGGVGTTPHLTAALFAHAAGITLNHVTYRGGAPAFNDVVAGQVGFLFSTSAVSVRQVQQGVVRGIAHTATAPLAELPDLPAVSATLPGFEAQDWYAVFAPVGTSAALVTELNTAIRAALEEPDLRQQMTQPGATVSGGGPEELGARLEAETKQWAEVIRIAGIQGG